MVISDISAKTNYSLQIHQPAYLDRLFAFIIDFLILSPVMGLFTAGVVGDFKRSSLGIGSDNYTSLVFQYLFICFVLFTLYETLFSYFIKATPGHYFLYLRVENTQLRNLNFVQLLFRSAFKYLSFMFLGLPFLEILFRDDRSMFYDRLSYTRVVSLKQKNRVDELPPQARVWILNWINSFVFVWFLVLGVMLYQITSRESATPNHASKIANCQSDMNAYLIKYLQEQDTEKSKECVDKIVRHNFDKALQGNNEVSSVNYFAKFVIADEGILKSEYLKKFCELEKKNILCAEKSSVTLGAIEDKDLVYYLYTLNKLMQDGNPLSTFAFIDALYDKLEKNERLDNVYMQSYLKMKESDDRSPASQAEKIKLDFSQFKKRVGIKK